MNIINGSGLKKVLEVETFIIEKRDFGNFNGDSLGNAVYSAKFQITNSKSQISTKCQIQITKIILFDILNFGHWSLFVIWCLGFGA